MAEVIKIRVANKQGYVPYKMGGVVDLSYPSSKTRRGRCEAYGQISPTICAELPPSRIERGESFFMAENFSKTEFRIRKLTPRECGRLMDFSEDDITAMESVNSATQVYKQCGNSIVVDVLYYLFKQMM